MLADRVIFPGQGEARTAMEYLHQHGLVEVIRSLKQPVLGICIGQQLLSTSISYTATMYRCATIRQPCPTISCPTLPPCKKIISIPASSTRRRAVAWAKESFETL